MGSGALSGKMLLVRTIEIIEFMLILGQVRLSTGELCTAWVKIGKKTPLQIIFNNSRSSIKPGSAPDPNFVLQS